MGSDQFPLTQEFVAMMLGASRPTVTVVAGTLQKAGLIKYRHGHVTIVDRESLEVLQKPDAQRGFIPSVIGDAIDDGLSSLRLGLVTPVDARVGARPWRVGSHRPAGKRARPVAATWRAQYFRHSIARWTSPRHLGQESKRESVAGRDSVTFKRPVRQIASIRRG
jgi:Crp-like helix-turn-helix domain